jgi:aminoacrylate hydrolase
MATGTVDGLYYELHGGPVAGREAVILSSGLGGSGRSGVRRWTP